MNTLYLIPDPSCALIQIPNGTMIKLTDSSKLHALGWKHKVELQEGIKKVYKWYLNAK